MSKEINILVNKYVGLAYKTYLEEVFADDKVIFHDYDTIVGDGIRPAKIDIIVYSGGADVNPDLYSENPGKYTNFNKDRDKYEMNMYYRFSRPGTLNLGICRGSQFLTVMAGGSLIQHVNGHGTPHEIEIPLLGKSIVATSTHHQMMYPYELGDDAYRLIAWSKYFRSDVYLNGRNEEVVLGTDFLEPEIVFYNKTRSLAIQGHPELTTATNEFKEDCGKLIKHFLKQI